MTHGLVSESVSVIIPTYNGARKLPHAISSIASQTILPTELVIVVDGSTDNTLSVLERLTSHYSYLNSKIIAQHNSGRASAKNRGICEASYDLLVFLDDDMEPVNTWLECHLKHHTDIIDSIASGSLVPPVYSHMTDLRCYQEWLHHQWHPISQTTQARLSLPYIHAGNFSAYKSTLSRLGNFRTGLLDCEDRLLALDAMESSVPLYLLDSAKCTHHDTHSTTFEGMGIRALQYERARQNLIRLSPGYLRYPSLQPFRPKYTKAIIYHFCSHLFLLRAADRGFFLFLPRLVRYRLYSLLITAFSRFGC